MKFSIPVFAILMLLIIPAQAQDEPATEAFISANFNLQNNYNRVLCVAGDEACPAEVEVAVPCLIATCAPTPQTYPVSQTFDELQAAAAATQPGDLVIIMPGRHAGIQYEESGGSEGAYVHFLGWGTPGTIIIDGPADPSKSYLRHHFYMLDSNYIIVQNLAFENAPDGAGIFLSGYFSETGRFSHHLIALDVYSHNNYWGLHTTAANYILIQDSYFLNNDEEHGVYISGSGDSGVIRRNVFQGNTSSGLQINADPVSATEELFYYLENTTGDTCGLDDWEATWRQVKHCYDSQGLPDLGNSIEDGISEGWIIEQNVMTGNGAEGAAGINMASVRHSTVQNNLVYGNLAAGITCWDDGYAETKGLESSEFGCVDVTIVHNTMVDETGNRGALIISNDAREMTIANNIIVRDRYDAYEIIDRAGQGLLTGHNYYSAQNIENAAGVQDMGGNITGFSVNEALANFVAPGFAPWVLIEGPYPTLNPDRPDFHLQPDSVLATSGDATFSPTFDAAGNPRQGGEIGALAIP